MNFILDLIPANSPTQPRDGSRNGVNSPDSSATDDIRQLKMRLSPLREVEAILSKRLSMGRHLGRRPSNGTIGSDQSSSLKSTEIVVRSGSGWKALSKLHGPGGQDKINEMQKIISACCPDIVSLWENEEVQSVVSDHGEFQEQATTL